MSTTFLVVCFFQFYLLPKVSPKGLVEPHVCSVDTQFESDKNSFMCVASISMFGSIRFTRLYISHYSHSSFPATGHRPPATEINRLFPYFLAIYLPV